MIYVFLVLFWIAAVAAGLLCAMAWGIGGEIAFYVAAGIAIAAGFGIAFRLVR